MLIQKDFKAVAEIVEINRDSWPDDYDNGYCDAANDIARKLADYFATDNPRFDRSRFMKACELTE